MVFATNKERLCYQNREKITMIVFAVVAVVFSFLGYQSAFNEKINGVFKCEGEFRIFWNCAFIPLVMAVVPFIVKNTRKMLFSVMAVKIAATVISALFGINSNIHLPVFQDDWGIVFFIAVDIFIAVSIYKENNERTYTVGAAKAVLALMCASLIIAVMGGDELRHYIFRMIYMIAFYKSICTVVTFYVPRRMHFPAVCEKDGE